MTGLVKALSVLHTLNFNARELININLLFQVSILLKDSFLDSFPSKDQPFVKVCFLVKLTFLFILCEV